MPQWDKANGRHAISLCSKYAMSDLPQTRHAVSSPVPLPSPFPTGDRWGDPQRGGGQLNSDF